MAPDMENVYWIALALVLVLEGLFPAISPSGYRRMIQMMGEKDDRSLRIIGLLMMGTGALLIYILK